MNNVKVCFSVLFCWGLFAAGPSAASECELPTPKILIRTASALTAKWILPTSAELHSVFRGNDERLAQFRSWVRSQTNLSAVGLLENHLRVLRSASEGLPSNDPFLHELLKDQQVVLRVLGGRAGRLQPMTCLQSLPFRYFLRGTDLRRQKAELSAYFLTLGKQIVIVADFDSRSDSGARESVIGRKERLSLQKTGWRLLAHFHNHPFNFKNPYGDWGGVLAPSSADLQVYRAAQPEFAWITNGIETLVMPRAAYLADKSK
jgi:hypothetical protein